MNESDPDITPEEITGFRIYYEDLLIQGATVKEWEEAPDGVQVVIYYTQDGPSLAHGVARYKFPGSEVVKNGKWMGPRKFVALLERAYREA